MALQISQTVQNAVLDAIETAVSNLNADMLDGHHWSEIFGGNSDIGARVYNSANLSCGDTATLTPTFNSERCDTDTIHDTSTNTGRLTCKTAGKYLISAFIEWANNGSGTRAMWVRLNGATKLAYDLQNALGINKQHVSFLYSLAVNDYVEVLVTQNPGGAVNVLATGNYSPEFAMQKIA